MWKVEMLTQEGETELFGGGYHFTIKTVTVSASNRKEAEETALNIMKGTPYTCIYTCVEERKT